MKRCCPVPKQVSSFDNGLLLWSPNDSGGVPISELCPLPIAGSHLWNRIGNRLSVKRIEFKAMISPSRTNSSAFVQDDCRVAIVYDKQPNGAVAVMYDVFQQFDNTGAISSGCRTPLNPFNVDRFVVLMDRYLVLPFVGVGGVSGLDLNLITDLQNLAFDVDLEGLDFDVVLGGGTDGNLNNVRTGQFLLVVVKTIATPVGEDPGYQLGYNCTLHFEDI